MSVVTCQRPPDVAAISLGSWSMLEEWTTAPTKIFNWTRWSLSAGPAVGMGAVGASAPRPCPRPHASVPFLQALPGQHRLRDRA